MTDAEFLASAQNPDGSFSHLSSHHKSFSDSQTYTSSFFTALILDCLCDSESHPIIDKIKQKAADFLLSQLSENGTVNYWKRGSQEATTFPCPDDLDDTMLTLAALHRYKPELITPKLALKVVQLLTQLEIAPGGPYRTWVTDAQDEQWRDVDLAVNMNIAYFLSQLNIENQVLGRYIRQEVAKSNMSSPYYPSSWLLAYYCSRTGITSTHPCLDYRTSHKSSGTFEKSLRILALLNLQMPLAANARDASPMRNTTRKPYPVCFDPAIDGRPRYAGCAAVTCAFRLAAVSRYEQAIKHDTVCKGRQKIEKRILRTIRKESLSVSGDERLFPNLLQLHHDYYSHRIILAAHDLHAALLNKFFISPDLVDQLGAANLFGWYAYTIFDDILDEQKQTHHLAYALLCQQHCLKLYQDFFDSGSPFYMYVHRVINKTHQAMDFERTHLRIASSPNMNISFPLHHLADRSFGHALAPLGIIYAATNDTSHSHFRALETFYRHFLITRQLLDDAHDWKTDFQDGRLNAVSWELFRNLGGLPPDTTITSHVDHYFWETYFPQLLAQLESNSDSCQLAAHELKDLVNENYFQTLLAPVIKQVEVSKMKYEQSKELLKNL